MASYLDLRHAEVVVVNGSSAAVDGSVVSRGGFTTGKVVNHLSIKLLNTLRLATARVATLTTTTSSTTTAGSVVVGSLVSSGLRLGLLATVEDVSIR